LRKPRRINNPGRTRAEGRKYGGSGANTHHIQQPHYRPSIISEIEINPLIASPDGIIALDARVTLCDQIPENRMAIHPYPAQYVNSWTTPNGLDVTFRQSDPKMNRHEVVP